MASQYLTIAKIGGLAAEATLRQFQTWSTARIGEQSSEQASEQWPVTMRAAADQWADSLRRSAHQPPVVFYVEYVDLWSFCPPVRFLREHGLLEMFGDRYELLCFPLPFNSDVAEKLTKARNQGQWDEDRLFATLTLLAAESWNRLVDNAVLVFLRLVVSGTIEDQEIRNSLAVLPEWMESGQTESE